MLLDQLRHVADGEAGDHEDIFHPEYCQPPVRCLAALGDKRWLPCLWRPTEWWEYQMELARNSGAGVALCNGLIEYALLTAQPSATRAKMLVGIEELKRSQRERRQKLLYGNAERVYRRTYA